MPQISAVIITYNEELNIERCIKSLHGIADDIVVVDSFSTDHTEEICKKLEVRFITHAFEGHIEQKNWAITQARFPHVLSLDADEALSDELRDSILMVKNDWKYEGYRFNRLTNYCGKWIKHTGWYPDKKLRLWDSRKGCWTGENPHDRYELTEGCTQGYLKGDLYHYSYYTIEDHINQVNKFTKIAALAAYKKGKRSNILKILIKPLWKFLYDYFGRAGFADGYYGFIISMISSHATFLKYVKIKELQKNK
ncbi:MAG: glycosyl transferase [Bacteroidetes bacterium GWF2_38_335]|nr:MAG: glycosyl transferase [Bacteroidetes bacterium GWF2_38_335]OFY78471.1 MAG: glycosyl transferase [Bacteroidetes bacterium RIFOXYA12_FULL_38_20]HBS88418.1 glycosyltransferase family 2 protein [Bacteroidales bacterium]